MYASTRSADVLAPLCSSCRIEPRPSLLRLANVQHLATAVSGTLAREVSALALAAALHPTAAVCGTPAGAAMELIRELEGMDRGRYAGPVGWLDARGNGEWGIALRCGQLSGRRCPAVRGLRHRGRLDPAAELAEAQAKFRPVQDRAGRLASRCAVLGPRRTTERPVTLGGPSHGAAKAGLWVSSLYGRGRVNSRP